MTKHDHVPPPPACRHEKPSEHHKGMEPTLRVCLQCDAVECTACGKEWKTTAGLSDWAQKYAGRMSKGLQPDYLRPVPMPQYPGIGEGWISWQGDPLTRIQERQTLGLCSHGSNERLP